MFCKLTIQLGSFIALATFVIAGPVALLPNYDLADRNYPYFSNLGGFTSLNNFDNFYGADIFDGSRSEQMSLKQGRELSAARNELRSSSNSWLSNRRWPRGQPIITERIYEVETQTIVFEQWHFGLHGFSRDLRRHTDHQVGFDRRIAGHFHEILNVDGSFNTHDFGFSGRDIGRETIIVRGHNWDDIRSRVSVEDAYCASRDAYYSIHRDLI